MRCDDVRVSLSARLDGEATPLSGAELEGHLRGCAACQAWLAGAERVTRAVRLQAVAVPDLTARILAAARTDGSLPSPAPATHGGRLRVGLQWALGLLALAQLMLSVPDLLGALDHQAHAGREVAALDIALAVGLLVVACCPEYARVFSPVVMTLVVCLASASGLDLLQGIVTPGQVAIHTLAVGQAALVWLLARTTGQRPALARGVAGTPR
jgi:predicted anti-sigma-YlaC factor YlaD